MECAAMTYLTEIVAQVRAWDAARARSQQQEVGWSGIFGCRAWLGYILAQEWATEDTDTWRAIAGTALHEWLQSVREKTLANEIVAFELAVKYKGIPGHIDEVNFTRGEITDYKFPSLKSARLWDDPEVQDQRFIQPQGYAAAVVGSAQWRVHAPDPDHATVRILCAPVDGTFSDWKTYERPFDRSVADRAVENYEQVQLAHARGEELPKDKPLHFCKRFCEFYSTCRGGETETTALPEITDPYLAAAIERYGLASEAIHAGYKVRDELRPVLEGLRGRARGFKVFMSRSRARDKWVWDDDAIREVFAAQGLEIPMKQADGKKPSLYVMRESK
jgi:PD-(D/E)XK nuclease superfamily